MLAGLSACAARGPSLDFDAARQQVTEVEMAFARTMANRDLTAFASFIAPDAVFFSGKQPLRGRDAVVAAWKPFFDAPEAPFSWSPDHVEISGRGSLGMTTGPVYSSAGKLTGRFNSIWRREASGEWRVVFDKGSAVCPPSPAEQRRP